MFRVNVPKKKAQVLTQTALGSGDSLVLEIAKMDSQALSKSFTGPLIYAKKVVGFTTTCYEKVSSSIAQTALGFRISDAKFEEHCFPKAATERGHNRIY